MEVGAKFIGMVNTKTKGFCKDTIEKLTKNWTGGSYLILRSKTMVPGVRPLLAIGYKYHYWQVLSFIATEGKGSTKAVIKYLPKYPDQFSNVSVHPVARPHIMAKFFKSVNEIDPTPNPDSQIQPWESLGLLIVIGYVCVLQFLLE